MAATERRRLTSSLIPPHLTCTECTAIGRSHGELGSSLPQLSTVVVSLTSSTVHTFHAPTYHGSHPTGSICYFALGTGQSTAMSMSVRLSVRSQNSKTTRPNFTKFVCIDLSVAVTRSSSDGVAIRCVLPVLWMSSCSHIMALRVYS